MNVNEIRTTPPQVSPLKPVPKKSATAFEGELAKNAAAPSRLQHAAELTNSEQTYFQELFPKSSEEIRSYNPYKRDGATTDARVGSLLDRRG